jgi:hypothetical protein
VTATEPWAEYQLEDGTLLRFRLTACNFSLTGKKTELGDPEYSFTHALQIETHVAKAEPVRLIYAGPEKDMTGIEALKPLLAEYVAPAEDCG